MSKRNVIAVDLGASGGKIFAGTVGDGEFTMNEIHRFAHEGVSFFKNDSSGVMQERTYWDDVLIYSNILEGLRTFSRNNGAEQASIGVDTWGADGQLLTADGDLLGNIYCYRDHRLDHMVEEVKKSMDPVRVYEITGIHFQPFNVSNQLYWLVKNRPKLLELADIYLPVPALFNYYLGGVRKVDSAWASVTQLMDAKTRNWSGEMLSALGIPARIMPEIVPPGSVVGDLHGPLASEVGLPGAKIIAVASHDTASAFAAAPVSDPEKALIISSGTWSLVGKLVPQPVTTSAAMEANLSNEGGIGNVRLLKNCMGTWLVQELRRGWAAADGKEMKWEDITGQAAAAEPFKALVDPDAPCFYNPSDMQKAIADFCSGSGQPVPSTRGEYARVVYESLALKYRMVNEQICTASDTETEAVHVVGGGSKNEMLNQFTADAVGLPVHAGPEEATAIGNMAVQAVAMGAAESMAECAELIRSGFSTRKYSPEDTDSWNKAYERFRNL